MNHRLRIVVPEIGVWVHVTLLTGAVALMAMIVATPGLLSLAT